MKEELQLEKEGKLTLFERAYNRWNNVPMTIK